MSCVEESARITRAEKKVVDSLVVKQTKELRIAGDSLCDLNFETSVAKMVDSLLIIRFRDMKKILER